MLAGKELTENAEGMVPAPATVAELARGSAGGAPNSRLARLGGVARLAVSGPLAIILTLKARNLAVSRAIKL
jgi:hypothetical protein